MVETARGRRESESKEQQRTMSDERQLGEVQGSPEDYVGEEDVGTTGES